MKMTRDYFDAHAIAAIEFECEDGGRFWETTTKAKVKAHIQMMNDRGYYFSDVDFCCKQDDEHVRKFLNMVEYNTRHNPKFEGLTFYHVLDKALEAGLEV